MDDKRVYIMDVYNRGIYFYDGYVKCNVLICLYNIILYVIFYIKFKDVFLINLCNMLIYFFLYLGLKEY